MTFVIEKWMRTKPGDRLNAIVWCPKCDLRLGLTHSISSDGIVSPSLVCTHEGCDFHEHVQLEGWPNAPERNKPDQAIGTFL